MKVLSLINKAVDYIITKLNIELTRLNKRGIIIIKKYIIRFYLSKIE